MIPVLDLKDGQLVLASRGRREGYAPLQRSALLPVSPARDLSPVALARAFHDRLGCNEWYVADLDAIGGAAPQRPLVRALAAILMLDLARVGSGLGVHLDLVAALRHAHPGIELLAGGGIGSARDLDRLADAGCDGALVATALHDGRLAKEHIEAVRRR